MPTMPDGYFSRFDPAKNYDQHLFRAGYVLQSAELNEIQQATKSHIRGVADALFKDGDVVRDARIIVDPITGAAVCESGAVYIGGAVREVPLKNITVSVDLVVSVGIYLTETVVTELTDPQLRDPAILTQNYEEAGASRLKTTLSWGFAGDGGVGDFYPVYAVDKGFVRSKEPPPQLDSVTQALARYDRDSAGGTYVVSGLAVKKELDAADGSQVFTVGEGRARVNGYGVSVGTSRRLRYVAAPDLRAIDSEPHLSTTAGAQRVTLSRGPILGTPAVRITEQKTETLVHGGFTGAQDQITDTSVIAIISVVQGGTTYVQNTDYRLTAGRVDWSLAGAEVATGSSYVVTYQYIKTATPTLVDSTGFTVTGAVVGTLVLSTYSQKLPRIDRLSLDSDGAFIWTQGVSADFNPQPPAVPDNLLPLASVTQLWSDGSFVTNNSVRVVPMNYLSSLSGRLDTVIGMIAQQRLESNIHGREAGTKKGIFTDAFFDESGRDFGQAQTAAIVRGELTLPILSAGAKYVSADVTAKTTLVFTPVVALSQTVRTGSMAVNPYLSFAPIPAFVTLTPSVDRWTDVQETYSGPVTSRFVSGSGDQSSISTSVANVLVSSEDGRVETMRPIDVHFTISGFGPGERLLGVSIDGVEVIPVAV